jgi:hypothetical protein
MASLERVEQPLQGRVFAFAEVAPDVTQIQAGDIITGFGERNEYDRLVVAVLNATLDAHVEGPVPARSHRGLTRRDTPRYDGWWSHQELPSERVFPKNYNGDMTGASVTLLDVADIPTDQETGEPARRQVEVLLEADLRSTGRGNIGHQAVLLTAFKPEGGRRKAAFTDLAKDTGNLALRSVYLESRGIALTLSVAGAKVVQHLRGAPDIPRKRY